MKAALHAEAEVNKSVKRQCVLSRRKLEILLATDIAARGIDIDDLTRNSFRVTRHSRPIYSPLRAGRMGKEGTVVSLVTPQEERKLPQFAKN